MNQYATTQCGMNQHPSFSCPLPQNTPPRQDDPFAPADENAEWECDSVPENHCANQSSCELNDLKEQIECLKQQLNNPHHHDPQCHLDECTELDGYYHEDVPTITKPAKLTCIYHGATEDTPKDAYILRIPRDKNGYAYAYPKV
jgi:hypothetical protein